MANMKQVISKHNSKISKKHEDHVAPTQCNCRRGKTCPLDGKCLTAGIIYQATVKRQDNQKEETYIGLTENSFKTRYNGHTCSFRNSHKRNETALSQHIWSLKDQNIQHTIEWKIIKKCHAYSTTSKTCNLCTSEKFFIIYRPNMSSLNNRNELATDCKHRKKHLLCNY